MMMVALLVLASPVSGEETNNEGPANQPLSLEDCIRIVLDINSDMLIARDEISAAVERKDQARSEFLFKANTTYSYTRLNKTPVLQSIRFQGIPEDLAIGTINNWNWRTEFNQPVFTGFALVTSYELAKLGIDAAHVDLETTKLNLILQTKVAYFNLLLAEKGTIVAEDAVVGFEAQAKVAKDFFDVGMTPKNDYLKAQVEAANARQNLIRARNLVEIRRAELNNLLRFPVDMNTEVVDIMGYTPVPYTLDYAFEQAYQNRPELKAARLNTEFAQKNVTLAQSGYYPNLGLTFAYEKMGDTWKVDGSDFEVEEVWSLTAGLDWTFWEWGRTVHSVSENRVRVRQAEESERQLRELIALRVKESYLNLRESEENVPVALSSIEQAEENHRMSVERYKEQVTTNTEVLDAQTLLSQAKDNYYGALYRYNVALSQLRVAMGLLD